MAQQRPDHANRRLALLEDARERPVTPVLTWRDIDWLRSITRLPVLIKGIVRADDAVRAIEHGAAGIIVSNHGGRQLDTAIPSIRALPGFFFVL